MFKKLISVAVLCMATVMGWAQHALNLRVLDNSTGLPLDGATVRVDHPSTISTTDRNGHVQFNNLPEGRKQIKITYMGYRAETLQLNLPAANEKEAILVRLTPISVLAEEVLVNATRAALHSPTTYKNVTKEDLEKNNLGQDLPYLLALTPGIVVSSDAGAGVGYTGLRLRGSDATRVNVTINGVPLNNPESMGTFLVNLPDFASSIDNLQIQRGVGTSTNGAGAFGGSINIQTNSLRSDPYAELDNSVGSYNTWKHTVRLGTGLVGQGFSFDGRLSQIKSDGYIDRASSHLQSFFLTGAWHGENSLLRANVFSGKERTYQAWNGVPEDMMKVNRRYNEFTYDGQTDNYTQTHYQLHFSQKLTPTWQVNAALHYTKGAGYYEEFREDDELSRYKLDNLTIGDSVISSTDLVRRRWLDNDFYGGTYSIHYQPLSNRFSLTVGGAYNEYYGGHFGEVTWARFASNGTLGDRYYEDDGIKKDFNSFAKATYNYDKLALYADLQYRRVSYAFLGYDRNLVQLDQTDYLNFFNPKFGFTYQLNSLNQLYASYALASKEPIRDDYVESSITSRPRPEQLHNIELGWRKAGSSLTFGANLYGMFYKDQLIITGQLNDVGELIRHNVSDSYRIGAEVDALWAIHSKLNWALTAALSENTIRNYIEYVDLHDYSDQQAINYDKTTIAMSPAFVGTSELSFRPWPHTEAAFVSKYVSRQYLDNTSNKSRSLDPYFVNDLRLRYTTQFLGIKKVGLTLAVNNLFGVEYASSGYTWGHLNEDGSRAHYNYYYPQATTNFLLGLSLGF